MSLNSLNMRIHVLEGRLAIQPRFWMIFQLNDSLLRMGSLRMAMFVMGVLCTCCVVPFQLESLGVLVRHRQVCWDVPVLHSQRLVFRLASSHSFCSKHCLVIGFINESDSSALISRKASSDLLPLKTNRNPLYIDDWEMTFPLKMAPFHGTFIHFRRCFNFCVGGCWWQNLGGIGGISTWNETEKLNTFNLKSLVKSQIGGNMCQIHTFHRFS